MYTITVNVEINFRTLTWCNMEKTTRSILPPIPASTWIQSANDSLETLWIRYIAAKIFPAAKPDRRSSWGFILF